MTTITEADDAGMTELAAELSVDRPAELERAGSVAEAVRVAAGGADRCAALGATAAAEALRSRVQLQLARLLEDAREALRHLEAAFELGLAHRDPTTLGRAVEVLVSGVVRGRFADDAWRKVALFRDRLATAGFDALADTAEAALADLRGQVG